MAATARQIQGDWMDGAAEQAPERRGAAIDLVALARKTLGDRDAERAVLLQFDRLAGQCSDALARPGIGRDVPSRQGFGRGSIARPGSGEATLAALHGAARLVGAGAVATTAENCQHAARAGLHDADAVEALAAAIAEARVFLRDLLA